MTRSIEARVGRALLSPEVIAASDGYRRGRNTRTTRPLTSIALAMTLAAGFAIWPAQPTPGQVSQPGNSAYRTGEWSSWVRAEGIEYRFRWGLSMRDQRNPGDVDALFQIRSLQKQTWQGKAQSLSCSGDHVYGSSRLLAIQPNQTQDVKFSTPNCGSKERPAFRATVARSTVIDRP